MASRRSATTRKERTDERVFRATVDLLRTAGVHAVSVEAVSARSGVAKTTIYRRFDDRVEMLQAALDHYIPRPDAVVETEPRAALVSLVRAVRATVEQYIGTSVATLVTVHDDVAAQVVRDRVVQPRIDQLTVLLERWCAEGTLNPGLDIDLTVSTIMGTAGVTYARHGAFPPGWPERLVDHLWPLLRPPDDGGA